MDFLLLALEGAMDDPRPELGEKTPLQAARTPFLDRIAAQGQVGRAELLPEPLPPGPGAATLALLGYDPLLGAAPGPLEAAAIALPLGPRDIAFCVPLTATDGEAMQAAAPAGLTAADRAALVERAVGRLSGRRLALFPGQAGEAVLRFADGPASVRTVAPEEAEGKPLLPFLPEGDGADALRGLVFDSLELLDSHPVNRRRREEGNLPANTLWPWGAGRAVTLPDFLRETGLSGAVVASDPAALGVGRAAGLRAAPLPAVSREADAEYRLRAEQALALLSAGRDFVLVHLDMAAAAGRAGDLDRKVGAIEAIDREVVGPLLDGLERRERPFRLLAVVPYALPVATRQPRSGPALFVRYDAAVAARGTLPFDERGRDETRLVAAPGRRLLERLFS